MASHKNENRRRNVWNEVKNPTIESYASLSAAKSSVYVRQGYDSLDTHSSGEPYSIICILREKSYLFSARNACHFSGRLAVFTLKNNRFTFFFLNLKYIFIPLKTFSNESN